MISGMKFVLELRHQVPELESLFGEHIVDYDEILPHVLMSDVAKFAEEMDAKAAQGSIRATEVLSHLLNLLEDGMHNGDETTKELIAASFLENLDRDNPRFAGLCLRFGEALTEALEKQRGHFGED